MADPKLLSQQQINMNMACRFFDAINSCMYITDVGLRHDTIREIIEVNYMLRAHTRIPRDNFEQEMAKELERRA